MSHRALIFVLVALAGAAYPFVVYFTASEYGIRPLAIILSVILTLRVLLWQQFSRFEKIVLMTLIFLLCAFAAWRQSETLLRYYPVLMNLGFAVVFLLSLRSATPLIERLAGIVVKDFSNPAKRYLRGLTLAWGLLLTANALVSFYTACCLSLKQWTIYNGMIAYIVFALFTLCELTYRHFYKLRNPE